MLRSRRVALAVLLVTSLLIPLTQAKAAEPPNGPMVRIAGHVLPALSKATLISAPDKSRAAKESAQPITLTIVLRRNHQAAFEGYLKEIYDPHSKNFHRYLTQRHIADRFGPSRASYNAMLAYLRAAGFQLAQTSENRLTITVSGTRGDAERAFDVSIGDYRIGTRKFFANDGNPALPPRLASQVMAIAGLSDLSKPHKAIKAFRHAQCEILASLCWLSTPAGPGGSTAPQTAAKNDVLNACNGAVDKNGAYNMGQGFDFFCGGSAPSPMISPAANLSKIQQADPSPLPWTGLDGTGQTIGLVEFDNFETSDVQDYLAFASQPAALINNLTEVNVNGGVSAGINQDEVLLDIDTTLTMAPGAKTVVYDAPFNSPGASFQAVFNQMINDHVTIISNSWAYCEDQTTAADVNSIDTIFQNAAAAGISIFNGSGDTGSTCLDGSVNTVSVPADSPNATAVGGSSEPAAPGLMYGPETWWNGSNATPETGQGGYGISKFFAAASYQNLLTGSSMRSVPDVVMSADPAAGVFICQASDGGCPTGLEYGGTSIAAPEWAAMAALLNQGQGSNLGLLNPHLYPLANTSAFHNAAALGSDLAHVGLGSPNLNLMYLALTGQSAGIPSPTLSQIGESLPVPASGIVPNGVPADGATSLTVLVALRDANGNSVSGKTVTLSAGAGTSAVVTPSSAITTSNNGVASFTVTDLTVENLTFTATDSSDGIQVSQSYQIPFVTPPSVSADLSAFPPSVAADGVTSTEITLTLKDSLSRPSPGKLIQITQTGNSLLTGPNPPVTDSDGQIQFTATDTNNETVTYSATDVTDGNLPFPGTAQVTFSDAPEPNCGNQTPVAAPGYVVTPYVTGLLAQSFSYANGQIDYGGCPGASGIAFDTSGNIFVSDLPTGDIYKLPPGGGVASNSNLFNNTLGPAGGDLVYENGTLYAVQGAITGEGANSGTVTQINPVTGTVIGTVATGLNCPQKMAADPLTGNLFVDDACNGAAGNPALIRISNLGGSPTTSTYATLPSETNYEITFAPDGTIYVITGLNFGNNYSGTVVEVGGTNTSQPAAVTTLSSIAAADEILLAAGTASGGGAQYLISGSLANIPTSSGLGTFDLTSSPPSAGTLLANSSVGVQATNAVFGPDGCVYLADGNAVFRVTDTNGDCSYSSNIAIPSLTLTPGVVSPNPAQGSSQTLTASLHYATTPAGTPVNFAVAGANPQIASVNTNANGQASFTYTAVHQGVDTITAIATIAASPILSNQSVITWGPGSDVTFLSLNPSPTSGTQSRSVNLVASLTDASSSPAVPLAGQSISFTLGGSSCGGTTNASGVATCHATPGGTGSQTLTASFAGTGQYVASSASIGFNVVASTTTSPTPTATPTPVAGKLRVSPKNLNFGTVDVGSNKVKTVKITNLGKITKKKHPVPILIESESGVASPFSISQACADDDLGPRSKGVKPGTCEVSVTFTPTAAAKYEGTLVIKDNLEPGFGQSVGLKGAGKTPK